MCFTPDDMFSNPPSPENSKNKLKKVKDNAKDTTLANLL